MKPDVVFLKHILDEIDFVLAATSGKTVTDLLEDGMLQRACARVLKLLERRQRMFRLLSEKLILISSGSSSLQCGIN
jgi:uncharacterized protein with HEPN domain